MANENDEDAMNILINSYNPAWTELQKGKFRISVSSKIGSLGFNNKAQEEMTQMLNEKMSKNSSTASPVAQEGFRMIDEADKKEIYGRYTIKRPGKEDVVDPVLWNMAQAKKAKIMTALNSFMLEKPNATYAEMQVFLQGEQEKYVVNHLSNILRPITSPTADAREKAIKDRKENLK